VACPRVRDEREPATELAAPAVAAAAVVIAKAISCFLKAK
jgi:hypothetical protein